MPDWDGFPVPLVIDEGERGVPPGKIDAGAKAMPESVRL
jgi:hypothetical protein